VAETDPVTLHDIAAGHPGLSIVLTETHYSQVPWAIPFLKSVSNTSVEVSRWVIADGVQRLMGAIGAERILFGSRFPDSSMGNQLYNLHRNDLSDNNLAAICAGNLDRLLGLE
jgi:predicted TIM-barrel fold metal-dependent hydrolase